MTLDDENPGQPSSGAQPDSPGSETRRHKELRTITDARTMRALAHPVRIAIFEALGLGGPMTATEVGELIGESPTTCSFHLRQLAKYGFVEEAGGGKGRARPWRITSLGISIPATHEDPEVNAAAKVLKRVSMERQLARLDTWNDTRSSYPKQWQDAATDNEYVFFLTARELEQLQGEVHDLLMRWFGDGERIADPSLRPAGSVPVELLLFAYPLEVPKRDSTGEASTGKTDDAEEDSR